MSEIIQSDNLEELWFKACRHCAQNGHDYLIEHGSFSGGKTKRRQLETLVIKLANSDTSLTVYGPGGVPVATEDDTLIYFSKYLLGNEPEKNEQYTYGERISVYIPNIVKILRNKSNGNQAVLSVSKPDDVLLDDPPCLRSLAWKVQANGKVMLTSYWRSWDLVSGMPVNMGGLILLHRYVCTLAEKEHGMIQAFSDGAHIYDYSLEQFLTEGDRTI